MRSKKALLRLLERRYDVFLMSNNAFLLRIIMPFSCYTAFQNGVIAHFNFYFSTQFDTNKLSYITVNTALQEWTTWYKYL